MSNTTKRFGYLLIILNIIYTVIHFSYYNFYKQNYNSISINITARNTTKVLNTAESVDSLITLASGVSIPSKSLVNSLKITYIQKDGVYVSKMHQFNRDVFKCVQTDSQIIDKYNK